MDNSSAAQAGGQPINLQTLVSVIAQAVQAQSSIAVAINNLKTVIATAFPPPLTGSATWDPGSIANGAAANTTVAVAGAAVGNFVSVSLGVDLQGLVLSGYVSATNTVTAVLANNTGGAIDLASSLLRARVTT